MSIDPKVRVVAEPGRIDAQQWNTLLDSGASATPFMRHEYLLALHESGSATARTGWMPQFIEVRAGGELIAACPLYLKSHSYGEYMFLCSIV